MMKKITVKDLPGHEECGEAVSAQMAPPLHQFIYDYEPADKEDSDKFRKGIADMLNDHPKGEVQAIEAKVLVFYKDLEGLARNAANEETGKALMSAFLNYERHFGIQSHPKIGENG